MPAGARRDGQRGAGGGRGLAGGADGHGLHQFHNRTYAQVADELNMSPKAAKSLLYRARSHLREALQRLVR
jgi:hypothetical protein